MSGNVQVSGQWDADQDNGFVAHFNLRFTGATRTVVGLGGPFVVPEIDGGTLCSHSNGSVKSVAASGYVQNDYFELIVTWDNRTQGKYTGFLQRSGPNIGLITGDTVDMMHAGNSAKWKSSRNFPL